MNPKWLLPLAVVLHNTEEAIWLPGFRARHGWHSITPFEFRMGTAIVALLAIAVTLATLRHGRSRFASWCYYAFCWIMLLNVFWHAGVAIYVRAYVPGLLTAVAFVLPVTLYLIIRGSKGNTAPAPGAST